MRNGIAGGTPSATLPYAEAITAAADITDFSPLLAYAIKWNETADLPNAATVISGDGGHGLFQLTASFPPGWADPYTNALYAIDNFLAPAEMYWSAVEQGDDLVRCIAAEFNAGRGAALAGHALGDVDLHTTDHYARRCLEAFRCLVAKGTPT